MRIMANYNYCRNNQNNENRDRETERGIEREKEIERDVLHTLIKRQSKMLVVSGFRGGRFRGCRPGPARGCFSYFHVIYTKLRPGSALGSCH